MPAKPERPSWDDLPESKRNRYAELGLDRSWYNSPRSASSRGDIYLPFIGERSDTGERGLYRLTFLSAEHESAAGEQAARVHDYLAFGRDPTSRLDGMTVEGVDQDTGRRIEITLTSDTALVTLLRVTGELRYEQFYQRVSR